MHLTLTTDGSWYMGEGGFAFYIRHGQTKVLKYGKLKQSRNCLDAELMAIANGLRYILGSINQPVSKVIVNTDSQPAILYLSGGGNKKSYQHITDNVVKSIRQLGCVVEYRHVKAHSDTEDSRSKANKFVDKYAKIGRLL